MSAPAAGRSGAGDGSASVLATAQQREIETLALSLFETAEVRGAREAVRARLLVDPAASTPDGRLGLERALDQWTLALCMRETNGDPYRPRLVWSVDNTPRTWFGHTFPGAAVAVDNPDNINREAPIDGDSAYELTGRLSARSTQLTIMVEVEPTFHAGIGRNLGTLMSQQLRIESDGAFVVTLDALPTDGRDNHIQIESGRLTLFTRDSLADWSQIPTALEIRRVSGPAPPAQSSPTEVTARIAEALPAFVNFWCGFKDGFLDFPEPNRVVGPNGRVGGWGFLAGGRFNLSDDEALVITLADGGANYLGFQISDPWTIAPDPVWRLSSRNKVQALANPDGTRTYVLSRREPGAANWIDTVGLTEGWFLARWQGVPPTASPNDFVRHVDVVKLAELGRVLPKDCPSADLGSRQAELALRASQHRRRTA